MAATEARFWAAAAALGLVSPLAALADTAPTQTEVQFKWFDYTEDQPGDVQRKVLGGDRVAVRAATLGITAPIGERASVAVSQTVDSISGASPAYHSQQLTPLKDFRRAWVAGLTAYGDRTTGTVTVSDSRERDYFSKSLGVQGSWATEDKNTTLTGGLGWAFDSIQPTYGNLRDAKRIQDALIGITRVLTPTDIVQVNLSHLWGTGYFTDPYKLADERPRSRHITRVLARWNHHVESTGQTLRTSYRYSQDSWSVRGHTLSAEWVTPLGQGWAVTPSVRAHSQTQANFYTFVDPAEAPLPPLPAANATFYSADQRLGAFGAWTLGLRIDKAIGRDMSVDLKLEQYEQRGKWAWSGRGDPGLVPFRAQWIQVGWTMRF